LPPRDRPKAVLRRSEALAFPHAPHSHMKALVLQKPGHCSIETIPDPVAADDGILLKVRMVGFCGSDLNSFRGLNPLVFPRILGHEVSATVVKGDGALSAGTDVALSPYTSCGTCASIGTRVNQSFCEDTRPRQEHLSSKSTA
jgi:threonine dehydrogenase-like Zn-dependent dehydrogenase